MKNKTFYNKIFGGVIALLAAMLLSVTVAAPMASHATSVSGNASSLDTEPSDEMITDEDRQSAYILILEHIRSIETLYDLSQAARERIDAVFYRANVYIANTEMTVGQLNAYVAEVQGDLTAAAGDASINSSTCEFLFLANETPITEGRYGQSTTLVLSVINLGQENITDVVITPNVSTLATEWPFEIETSSDVRMIASVPAADSVEQAYAYRQDISWNFMVSEEALTGVYPLTFHVQYYRNGNIEETDLTTYADIVGSPGNGSLDSSLEEGGNVSTPRIIVTGFVTEPEAVYAGDTFDLTIFVQNTSQETAVSNIQFDLEAAKEGNDANSMYEAFLPTSGSATIYVDSIAPGATREISIEMTARNDLSQKPYVITVNADYEDEDNNAYTATTNVSIPVLQMARVDTGEAEVLPESIAVGSSANVMFSIYNMGRTTLYNVQVAFEGETVAGGSAFLGQIAPGATGNVDVMVDGIAPTMDEGYVTAVITYEDEAGNVSTLEKEVLLYVYEEYYEDVYYEDEFYDDGMYDYEEEGGGSLGTGWIIAIVAVVVIAVIVVIIIVVSKKKKKKQQALLAELADVEEL